MKYKVVISPAAAKFIMRLPARDYAAIRRAVTSLSEQPWPVQSGSVVGSDFLRLRVRRYRVIYAVDSKEKVVYIERVARRSEKTYRGL